MKKIFKYKLLFTDMPEIEMPIGAEILTIDKQGTSMENTAEENHVMIWAVVDDEETQMETRKFRIAGTGHPLEDFNLKYINTMQLFDGYEVYHIFEIV